MNRKVTDVLALDGLSQRSLRRVWPVGKVCVIRQETRALAAVLDDSRRSSSYLEY